MNTRKRIKTVWTLTTVLGLVVAFSGSLQARLLVYEPFDYPDGWLTGQGGALGTVGTWASLDTGESNGWRVHPEGQLTGIAVDVYVPPTGGLNVFDGTVDNLPTTGGFAGMAGPEDRGLAFGTDGGTGNLDASIGLDPSVTASFQSATTTWFSYVGAHAWDRNQGSPQFMICTDTTTNGSRGLSLINSGNGIGATGGPPRFNLFEVYPQYFSGGVKHQSPGGYLGGVFGAHDGVVTAFCSTGTCDGGLVEVGQPRAYTMAWQVSNPDGSFGAANIVIGKIEWDADTGGEDIISVVRFLETDTLSEAAFDALIAAQPALSSRNWPSNKPDLDQSQFDTLNFSSLKFFVDEIRIATTFNEVIGEVLDPNLPSVDAGDDMITWSGQAVQLDPNVVNNDTTEPQGILTYLWTAEPNGIGDPNLDVVITGADQEDASVTITKTAPTGDATVVTMTLAVTLEGKDPVTDTMTIDVYDDACLAAIDLGLAVIDPTDLDENCITNFEDIAVMATTWLVDYTLTEPVAKP